MTCSIGRCASGYVAMTINDQHANCVMVIVAHVFIVSDPSSISPCPSWLIGPTTSSGIWKYIVLQSNETGCGIYKHCLLSLKHKLGQMQRLVSEIEHIFKMALSIKGPKVDHGAADNLSVQTLDYGIR